MIKFLHNLLLRHKIFIIIGLVILITVALLLFWSSRNNSDENQDPKDNATIDGTSNADDNNIDFSAIDSVKDETIKSHLQAQSTEQYQKVRTTYSDSGLVTELEVEIENNELSKFHAQKIAGGKIISETIGIKNTIFAWDTAKKVWWHQDIGYENTITDPLVRQAMQYIDEFSKKRTSYEFKFLAEENCEDRKCLKYEMKKESRLPIGSTIWIDKESKLLHKLEIKLTNSAMTMVYNYEKVDIKAPNNSTLLAEDKNIFEVNQ